MKKADIEQQPRNLQGGGKSVITWNRALWLDGAQPKRSLRLDVTVPILTPSATGMPEPAEVDALEGVLFRLEKDVGKRAKGLHALTETGAGVETHVFYLAPSSGMVRKRDAREVLGASVAAIGTAVGRELKVEWTEDAGWDRLLGIFIQHDPHQWLTDRALLIHMAKAEDAVHARRPIAHKVFFEERAASQVFLRAARKLRLMARGGAKPAAASAPGNFVVVVERTEPTLATWHLHPVVLEVKALVAAHGGTYHGWEAEFIQSLVPPPLQAPAPKG